MKNINFKSIILTLTLLLSIGVGEMWATDYILGPDGSWTQNAAHTLGSSGISNWVYKDLTVSGQWTNFKVLNGSSWYGKDSGGNNVTVGTSYTPTTTGDNMYCDFKAGSLTYYFFFNTSTKKLMIQPKYYLAGTCGASDQNWSTTANAPTYDATNGYFKWNTSSLTAGTAYKFKLVTYNSWSYYNYQDGGSVSVSQGTHETTDGDNNIIFTPTYGGTAVVTMVPTSNVMVVHCPYQVSYNKGANGTGTNTTASKTWKTNLTLLGATFTRAGYTQDGWSTVDGGAKVYNLSGSYTTDADVTLYPHWVENMSSVSLVASPTGKGSFTIGGAAATSTTAGVTTTRSVTAVPISGYHFVSWAVSGGATISSTTTNPTSVTGNGAGESATLTATFAADDVYSLTVAAGTGISAVTGSTNDIKANQSIAITATVATGYTWSTWTKTGAGTLSTFTAGTRNQTVKVGTAGDITLTASATENMSTLTTSNHFDVGSPSYAIPTKSKSSIGITTTATLTATTPGTGYTFAGWTLSSNLVVTSGNAATDLSITVRTNGNGSAATAQANYTEDLTTPYVIKGGTAITSSDWSVDIPFTKKSGESTGTVAYAEIPISSTVVTDVANTNLNLKVYNNSNSHWVGLNEGSGDWWYYSNSGEKTLTDNAGNNIQLRANVVGTYTVKLDYTTAASPKITITWPVALSIYRSNPNDDTNNGDHAWSSMPTSTSYRWTLDLEANTTYEFKINDKGAYYGHNTLINTSISNRDFATGTSDTKLETKSAGRFTFTWDATNHRLTVNYPKSVVAGASPASIYTGGTTTLTGYASELGSGSHTITYEFYKGTTLTDGNKIYTTSNTATATYQQASYDATVNFAGNATSQVYTVQIKEEGSVLGTNTVTVYRKWDIYVHDVDSWNAMYYYVYDNTSGDKREVWPGLDYSANKYNGTTTWYIVTLDGEYPHFIVNNNAGNKQTWGSGVYENDPADFPAGSFWYVDYKSTTDGKRYYDLHTITPTNPTVTLSASVANCKDITLTGTVTNCGGDGSFASDMKEVYFKVGGTKDAASIAVSSENGTFTKTLTNATAGATNTLQASAVNVVGTGSSSEIRYSNVTLNLQGGADGSTAVTAVNGFAMPAGATKPGKTGYTFGGYYASEGGSGKQYYDASMGSANNWDQTAKDVTIHAKWTAITYSVHFNGNGNTSGSMSNQTGIVYNSETTLTANTFVKTGYNFSGWATTKERADAGTVDRADGAAHGNLASTQGATAQLWAVWTPKQSALTLDPQTSATGYGTSGTAAASSSATYDAAMPALTGTMPTAANGYAFIGFYGETGGNGTQYYDGSGNSVHNWDVDTESGTTLYAYYKKAEITAITFDAATVEASGTVSFAVTVSPTPVEPTKLCFTVLHSNDNPLDDQPTITYNGGTGKYSFTASATSGTYKVQAVLRTGSTCDGGTELDTEVASFQVAGVHNVTVQYKCGDIIIKASETVTGRPLDATEITAPTIIGYTFSKWKAGDGITIEGADGNGEKASATINFTAIYDGKLTAIYTQKRFIYFYNTLNWENVYVYFYKDGNYWDNSSGTGTDPGYYSGSHAAAHKGQMLPVAEGSKIYYFDAEGASIPSGYTNVAFTEKQQDNCWYFYDNNKVSRRGDYSSSMPLFVPLSDQPEVKKNSNTASYYCEGYWMNYPANTGYTLRIYDTPGANNATGASREFMIPFSADTKMPLKQDVEINFSGESWFIIYRNDGKYLEGSHTFKQTDHGDKKITSTDNAGTANKMRLISDGSGIYTFTLSFYGDGDSPENYDYYINVDFPAAVGDYRIVYKDNATWTHGAHGNDYATWYHPSDIIGKNNSATETKEDTVSFFVSHGSSPAMKFQYISAINATTGAITWTDVTSGAITIPASITEAGVYNFIVSQPAGGASISLEKAEPYTGNYYIRTDCAGETKWNNFRSHDHLMNYSEYSITHGGYSHYYTHWVQTGDKPNIKFCIANEYSSAISDTLTRETAEGAWANIGEFITEGGNIRRNANVRFMWNQSTNVISRAYVDGAQAEETRFLVISSTDGRVKQADGSALSNNEVTFSDTENWIYEAYVKAQPTSQFKLVSTWGETNVITQYFKGSSSTTETLIDGSGTDWYDIRLLYDFKTNRLVTAWVPSDANIVVDNPINADVMFIREHQGDIAQLTFGESGKISKITTAYGVIRFNKYTLANKEKTGGHSPLGSPASIYERSLFWISFPFRVKLSEVFGFGTYGEHWAIQRYDGADRAARGHFLENGSFWRWMNRSTEYLEPNQGYLLAIDLDLLGESSSVWGPNSISDRIELYFPSYGTMPDITNASVTQTIPSHECTINRAATEGLPDTGDPRTSYNRTIFDSHWNVLSVPTYVNTTSVSFANTTWTAAGKRGPKFLYTWNADDNTITATTASGYTYHAMHSYMAQYAGDITWTASSGSPASIVARKTYAEDPKEVEFRLELQQNEKMIDRTFVIMSNDEEVSADFQFGEDMTKEFNASKASIYTFIPNVAAVAGNTLPMSEQTTVVPVGVEVKANGEYTFSMPDGTHGVGIVLVDNETGVRTSLGLMDYTVTLTAGKYDQRFTLEIPAIVNTPTGLEESGSKIQDSGYRKVMIGGVLYIIKDSKVYDARGARLQ